MAEWLWEEHGKVLFFHTCELGGFSARVEQRIRQGLIRPFRMRTRDDVNSSLSFETLHLASKGYVPARFKDAFSGEVEPGVPMIAPVTTVYTQLCPKCGREVKRTRHKSKLVAMTCPDTACKTSITLATAPPLLEVKQTAGFEQIGTFGFDGLTSASDWLLQDMSHRKNLEGEKAAIGGDIESGDMTFRGNNRSQVGMAQTRVHELVANSLGIPNLVVMPVWTAISHESSDDTGRLTIVGPKLAGDAKTYIASSWFGNVVEAQVVTNDRGEYLRRLYVGQWYDEHGRRHLCGHRGDPRFMEMYYEDAPYTDEVPPKEMCTGFSLNFFQRQLEASIQQGIATDTSFQNAPGVGAIPATYGDVEDQESTVKAAAAPTTARPGVARRPTPRGVKPAAAPAVPAAVTAPATATASSASTTHDTPAEVPQEAGAGAEEVSPAAQPAAQLAEQPAEVEETPAAETPGDGGDGQTDAPQNGAANTEANAAHTAAPAPPPAPDRKSVV